MASLRIGRFHFVTISLALIARIVSTLYNGVMARLTLTFLGTFQVTLDSQPVTRFRSSKNAGLLVYLALQSDRPIPREVLATLFWPEESESDARNNLRQAVYQLRKVLGDLENPDAPYLLATRQSVQFKADSDFALDVNHFWQSIDRDELEEAVAVYRDDLLPGFTCDSLPFEDWLRHKREQLHRAALEAMSAVTQVHLQAGRPDMAQAVARQQLALEPWRESACRQLMQGYALAGDRTNALAQYEVCREILWDELGIEPDSETVALYESIKEGNVGLVTAEESLEEPIEVRHNLPVYATPFIGRQMELKALDEFVADPSVRLVTLVGPGGIGKTRLAVAAAEKVADNGKFPEGLYYIDLAPLQETDRILQAIADSLGFPLPGGDDPASRHNLLNYLRQKRMLFVFDNFEHLLDGAALVADILQAAPKVKILVTSRERLQLQPEQVYQIDGLAFPDMARVGEAEEYSAVRLFLQSAHRNRPDFTLRDVDDLANLARICQLVAGMPLALQLAASWVDVLTLDEIIGELQQGLDILESKLRDLPDRQRSVRASFDYSWRRLDDKDQAIFAQVSIFRGGFTRDAAHEVTGASLRRLSSLVNKSLIRFDSGRGRYEIHELSRQYGAEKLSRQPEVEASARDRHSNYYLHMMAGFTDDLKGKGKRKALSAIEADLKNVLLAWDHASAQQNIEGIGISLESLWRFYWDYGRRELGEFEQAVANLRKGAATGVRGIVLGRLLAPLGRSYGSRGQTAKAKEILEESLDLLQSLGETRESLIPLFFLAEVQDSIEKSNRMYLQGLVLARAAGDRWAIAHALVYLAENARLTGDYKEAEQLGREALNQFKQNKDEVGIAVTLNELSLLATDSGRYDEALMFSRESIELTQGFNPRIRIMGLHALVIALYALEEYGEAEMQVRRAIAGYREFGREDWKFWLFMLGEVAFRKREYAVATQLYKDCLAAAVEFEKLDYIIQNHTSLSRLNVALGRGIEARKHLHAALQTAIQLGWRPQLLDCFVGIAELFSKEGDFVYAADLAGLVAEEPASRAMTIERAKRLLTGLEEELSSDQMQAIRQSNRMTDQGTVAAQVLLELEKP